MAGAWPAAGAATEHLDRFAGFLPDRYFTLSPGFRGGYAPIQAEQEALALAVHTLSDLKWTDNGVLSNDR